MTADAGNERYEQARQRVEAKMGFFTNLAIFVIINVIFLFVAGWDWLWVTLFWGIGIVFHAWSVFFRDSGKVADWKERQIQKELGRVDQPDEAAKPAPAPSEKPGPSDDPTVA